MKKYSRKIIIGMVLAAMTLLCIGAGLNISERAMWDYKAFNSSSYMSDGELNKLGSEGWELTGFSFASGGPNRSDQYRYIFKRPR